MLEKAIGLVVGGDLGLPKKEITTGGRGCGARHDLMLRYRGGSRSWGVGDARGRWWRDCQGCALLLWRFGEGECRRQLGDSGRVRLRWKQEEGEGDDGVRRL